MIDVDKKFTAENQCPTQLLPDEVILEIFSLLNLCTLGSICTVSKAWKHFASEPNLLKRVAYKEVAFGNDKWARSGGQDLVKDEDYNEEFASLPIDELIADCKKFKKIFPEKKAIDTLMLVRVTKNHTLKILGKLAKRYFPENPDGFRFIWPAILEELGDKSLDKSRWVVMTKDILPGSRKESFEKHKKRVEDLAQQEIIGYEVPEALVATACILAQYFDSKTRLFVDKPWTETSCEEILHGNQLVVGGFETSGLGIDGSRHASGVGVAAVRKF